MLILSLHWRRAPLRCRAYFDKIRQLGLKPALVEKRWLAGSIVTCIRGLNVKLLLGLNEDLSNPRAAL